MHLHTVAVDEDAGVGQILARFGRQIVAARLQEQLNEQAVHLLGNGEAAARIIVHRTEDLDRRRQRRNGQGIKRLGVAVLRRSDAEKADQAAGNQTATEKNLCKQVSKSGHGNILF